MSREPDEGKRVALPVSTIRRELRRKALHLVWGLVPVSYAIGVGRRGLLIGLSVATIVALFVEITRARIPAAAKAFRQAVGTLLRDHEHDQWSGATWLLIVFLIVTALFERSIAIAAMWAVAVGDASAALVGMTVGGYRLGHSSKTVSGSIACLVATMIGASMLAGLSLRESLTSGLMASIAEWPDRPLDDNIRIGLVVGGGILLSRMAFS